MANLIEENPMDMHFVAKKDDQQELWLVFDTLTPEGWMRKVILAYRVHNGIEDAFGKFRQSDEWLAAAQNNLLTNLQ